MIWLLIFMQLAIAEDHLLWSHLPIDENQRIIVATYYRNIPDYYYFTIVYQLEPVFERYFGRITFTCDHADQMHLYALKWVKKTYEKMRSMKAETFLKFPFNPFPEKEDEVYIIYPNRD